MTNNYKDKEMHILEEESLRSSLKAILDDVDLSDYRALLRSVAAELDVDYIDCASAMMHLHQSSIQTKKFPKRENISARHQASKESELKMIRYRLEVGRNHHVSVEALKNTLVEESGVDKKLIGYIDIHNHYTLIKLPEGMPAEIFNHLKAVQINRQALGIKRLGRNRRKSKREKDYSSPREANSKATDKQSKRVVNSSTRIESCGVSLQQKD